MRLARCPWVWVAVLAIVVCWTQPACAGRTVYLVNKTEDSTHMSLRDAFKDKGVSTLILDQDVVLNPDDWAAYQDQPLMLDRNVSIVSNTGAVLDFNYTQPSVLLVNNASMGFNNVVINNIRRGPGLGVDFMSGLRGTSIVMDNVIRQRLVCNPLAHVLTQAETPRPDGRQQDVEMLKTFTWRGQNYSDVLHLVNVVSNMMPDPDQDPTHLEEYLLVQRNVTRVCMHTVSDECVRAYGEDYCIAQLLAQLLKPTIEVVEVEQPPNLVPIVVPTVLGSVLILAATALLLHRWRQHHRRQLLADAAKAGLGPLLPSTHGGGGGSVFHSSSDPDQHRSGPLEEMVFGDHRNWQVVAYNRCAEAGGAAGSLRDKVSLGVMVGAGSFGRVYRGTWQAREVAIKVMHHDSSTAAAIANEVDLMLSFAHPNVVKAYHFVTWAPARAARLEDAKAGPGGMKEAQLSRSHSLIASQPSHSLHSSGLTAVNSGLTAVNSGRVLYRSDSQKSVSAAAPAGAAAAAAGAGVGMLPPPPPPAAGGGGGAVAGFPAGSGAAAGSPFAAAAAAEGPTAAAAAAGGATLPAVEVGEGPPGSCSSGSGPDTPDPATAGCGGAAAATGPSSQGSDAPVSAVVSVPVDPCWQPPGGHLPNGEQQQQVQQQGQQKQQQQHAVASAPAAAPGTPPRHVGPLPGTTAAAGAAAAGVGASAPLAGGSSVDPGHVVMELGPALYQEAQNNNSTMCSSSGMNARSGRSNAVGGGGATGLPTSSSRTEGDGEAQTWLIVEYCDGGALVDQLHDGVLHDVQGRPIMERLLVRLRDVACGMQYLHSRNVLHGDLKAANVLLSSNQLAPFGEVAKVSDFGLSRSLNNGQTHRSTRTVGTVSHMPPELLRVGKKSPAGDVYAFGVMMWELYCKATAFKDYHYGEVFERVALGGERPPVPVGMPEGYTLLMTSCWAADPLLRPGFQSIVQCLQMMLDQQAVPEQMLATVSRGGAAEGEGGGAAALPPLPEGLCSPYIGDL